MSEETKGDKARRMDIKKIQNMAYVWFPYDCVCSCGFDFIDYPKAYKEIITGCPSCHRSYCE
jgi:hypothetical protein